MNKVGFLLERCEYDRALNLLLLGQRMVTGPQSMFGIMNLLAEVYELLGRMEDAQHIDIEVNSITYCYWGRSDGGLFTNLAKGQLLYDPLLLSLAPYESFSLIPPLLQSYDLLLIR